DSTGQNFINSLPVDFVPITMNSQGRILMSVPGPSTDKVYIYDPATAEQTYLGVQLPHFAFQSSGRPQALNHRSINIANASGQFTTKISPQVVGYQGSLFGSNGATIWEENPKTGQY